MSERVVICTVEGSRTMAVVPVRLLADRERVKWEAFFRELLLVPAGRVVHIRESA